MQKFFRQSWTKYFESSLPSPIFIVLCVDERPWCELDLEFSFLLTVFFFCMETTVVSVSFANFHFCRQSSLCMWMTLVWINLASFHYFGQSFLCIWIASLWNSLAKFHFFGQCSLCDWMVLVWISFANSHFFGQSFLECEIPWYELAL